ncbi:MAG: hypothetical protein IJB63_05310 [Alistipes sp.]|nr:hypothetical protein [Alistipes sp.]
MHFPESFLIKNNPPLFNKWVPSWLGTVMLLLLLIPAALIGGVYSSNLGDMSSGLGILSEHILFANFATAIGMMAVAPFAFQIVARYRFRDALIWGFCLLLLLSGICAVTDSIPILIGVCFLLGIVRVIVIIVAIFAIAEGVIGINVLSVLTPPASIPSTQIEEMNTGRGMALNLLYAYILSIGQVGSYLTSYIAYHFRWQYSYLIMMGLVIVGLICILLMMAPNRERGRIKKMELPSFTHIIPSALFFLSLSYILTYGKTYDWFDDERIAIAGCLALLSLGVFILQQVWSSKRLIESKSCFTQGVIISLFSFFMVMILSSSSSLVSAAMGLGMKLDGITSAAIGNYQFIGYVAGAIINIVMIIRKCHPRWILALGFSLITIATILLHFQFQTQIAYSQMVWPTILRSTGMFMIYAYCGYYGLLKFPNAAKWVGIWVFLMMALRSVLGPVAGASTYSNAIYHRSQNYIERFAVETDATSNAASTFKRTQMGLMYQGKSYDEATQMASLSTKGNIQIQATLVTLKEISGWTIWLGIACVGFVIIFPYEGLRSKKHKEAVINN